MEKLSRLSRSIAGKVAVITGAASGMGAATAKLFADEGAKLALCDIQTEALEKVSTEIQETGAEVLTKTVDLTNPQAIKDWIQEIAEHFGSIDILVNNAGLCELTQLDAENFQSAWDKTLSVNLQAQALLAQASLPFLRHAQDARIINIASVEGLAAMPSNTPYAVSKHGVIGLTKSLAVDLASQGITVNCICPGPINTGMTSLIPEEAKQKYARRYVPLSRYGDAEEIAHAVLNFALPASSFTTGAVLLVDGGLKAKNP